MVSTRAGYRHLVVSLSRYIGDVKMKKTIITAVILILAAFFIIRCNSDLFVNNHLQLDKDQIEQINIASLHFGDLDIKDQQQVTSVVNCLTSLNPIESTLNPYYYVGGCHHLMLRFKNGWERKLHIIADKFLVEEGKFTCEISPDDAERFSVVIADIMLGNQMKGGGPYIDGTVVSVVSATDGGSVSCIIRTDYGDTRIIYVRDAQIIDGTGWLILHENDEIRVFYPRKTAPDAYQIEAMTVYIMDPAIKL